MALTLYYLSGSPYAWRVWLALEHKSLPHDIVPMSYDADDFRKPDFVALNPRRRVPVLVDDGFALYESSAIVEYIEDKWPDRPRLLADNHQQRALQRRMVREADQYFATPLEHLVEAVLFTPAERQEPARVASAWAEMKAELASWEPAILGDYLAGNLSAADFALFPLIALGRRIAQRNPGLVSGDLTGPRLSAWLSRMEALPVVTKTWPPHWRPK